MNLMEQNGNVLEILKILCMMLLKEETTQEDLFLSQEIPPQNKVQEKVLLASIPLQNPISLEI